MAISVEALKKYQEKMLAGLVRVCICFENGAGLVDGGARRSAAGFFWRFRVRGGLRRPRTPSF